MELEVKRNSSMSSMIAASVLITLITLSTLTIGGIATPALHNKAELQEHHQMQHVDK